jgi:hypothetical protein
MANRVKFFKIYEKLLNKAKENCEFANEYDKYSWVRTPHLIQIYNDCTKKYVYEIDINSIISEAKKIYISKLDKSLDKYKEELLNGYLTYGLVGFEFQYWSQITGVSEDFLKELLRYWIEEIKKTIDMDGSFLQY